VKVSDIVMDYDECLLDEDTTIVPSTIAQKETPNTFGKNLLYRLGIAHGHTEAEVTGSQSSHNPDSNRNRNGFSLMVGPINCTSNGKQ